MNRTLQVALLFALPLATVSASTCYGTPAQGRLQGGVQLPVQGQNYVGYELEFDASGSLDDLQIDFDAMAEHLYQLAEAAKKRHVKIKTVIFQKELTELLFKTKRGQVLRSSVPFMKTQPWIKHDEHYHVDFSIPCRPFDQYRSGMK